MQINKGRIKALKMSLGSPVLIKKKENLLYLTGRSFLHGYLLVLPLRTTHYALNTSVVFLGDGLEKIEGMHSDFLKNVGKYMPRNRTLEVYGDFTYAEVKYIKFKNPELKLKVVVKHDPVDHLRTVKDESEIKLIRKSMEIVEQVFKLVRREIKKPGMTEIKLAEFIKQSGLRLGAENISFPPIVAAGVHAAVPHHVPDKTRLKPNQSIIIDFGFKYKNYCSDFTRTIFLKSAPKKLAEAYNQVEKAYWGAIEFINNRASLRGGRALSADEAISPGFRLPRRSSDALVTPRNDTGVTGEQVYQKAVDILAEKHLEKYFIHSLGHGTGLEIHELPNLSPKSRDQIKKRMVFSIEPGVYLPKTGGIRIEDLVYLEKKGVKKFINVPTSLKDNVI